MHKLTIFFLLFLIVPDLYIYLMYIIRLSRTKLLRLLWWMPTIGLVFTFLYFFYLAGDNVMANNGTIIGRMGIGIMLFALPKTLFVLFSLAGVTMHWLIKRCPRTPFTVVGTALALFSAGVVLYGSLAGTTRFQVNEVEYHSDRLPQAFDGYRVLQISDLHIGSWQGREGAIRRLVELINGQQADVILFTGDLVNQQSRELDTFIPILSELSAPDGVYSVLGNHDYGDYYHWPGPEEKQANLHHLIDVQKAMGWKLLNNTNALLCRSLLLQGDSIARTDSIALIGVENDGEPPFSQHADLQKALTGTDGMFKLLMSHNPTHWRREVLPTSDIDLMLAGHTHAMQSVLFGRSLAELKYPEWRGFYYEDTDNPANRRALYVNIGIGYVGFPFRFGAWPEITVITLKRMDN